MAVDFSPKLQCKSEAVSPAFGRIILASAVARADAEVWAVLADAGALAAGAAASMAARSTARRAGKATRRASAF